MEKPTLKNMVQNKITCKLCIRCNEVKDLKEFTAYPNGKLYLVCKECHEEMDNDAKLREWLNS